MATFSMKGDKREVSRRGWLPAISADMVTVEGDPLADINMPFRVMDSCLAVHDTRLLLRCRPTTIGLWFVVFAGVFVDRCVNPDGYFSVRSTSNREMVDRTEVRRNAPTRIHRRIRTNTYVAPERS
jgi:hypothetical protein